jgi:Uncharacterized conserved protein
MTRNVVLRTVWEYITLTLACFIFAMAWECFMIPNGMSAGGLMGLSTIIQFATGGAVPAQYTYFGINAVLIIIAVMAMGIGFGFKTIWCIVMSSVAMQIVAGLPVLHAIPGSFFYMEERLLIPVVAGVFESVGLGLVLRYGGSTGGTDIIALMINKYWPVSLGTVFLLSDVVICALLLCLPEKNFSDMCYGLTEVVIFSLVIDIVVGGKRSSYQLLVFSEHYEKIADHIIHNMDRGVTVLKAQGWYTKSDKNVLLILINQRQLSGLSQVIKEIDPRAFMTISPTHNVYGEGFEEIKSGVHLKKKKRNE